MPPDQLPPEGPGSLARCLCQGHYAWRPRVVALAAGRGPCARSGAGGRERSRVREGGGMGGWGVECGDAEWVGGWGWGSGVASPWQALRESSLGPDFFDSSFAAESRLLFL